VIVLKVVAVGTSTLSKLFMIDVTSNIILIMGIYLKSHKKLPSNFKIFWAMGHRVSARKNLMGGLKKTQTFTSFVKSYTPISSRVCYFMYLQNYLIIVILNFLGSLLCDLVCANGMSFWEFTNLNIILVVTI
jgi:hypothetical protein